MEIRVLVWSISLISGVLVTWTGVHYFFTCNTTSSHAKYAGNSFFNFACPVNGSEYDVVLAVPASSQGIPSWGLGSVEGTVSLRQHHVHRDWVTLSGFSSGGTFAQQFQISYSSLFSGIASFSHAYYRCGGGPGTEALYDDACTIIGSNQTYDPDLAIADLRRYEQQGLIENTRNLRNKKLYLYAPMRSNFFDLDLLLGAIRVYEPFIQNPCTIKTRVQDANQLLPTANFGTPCRENPNTTFFLGNCGFSGAYEALQFLIGDVIRSPPAGIRANPTSLMAFDQTEFFHGFEGEHFMDSSGYIYVPRQCYHRPCFLHFYFHGCFTGRQFNEADHFVNSGFLELAEYNDLIVVAPQVLNSTGNEIGCWDTYGLTGQFYATQRGSQVTVVRNILARILGDDNRIDRLARQVEHIQRVEHHERISQPNPLIKSIITFYDEYKS